MRRTERTERGTAVVEMALLLAFIAALCIGALSSLGTNTDGKIRVLGTQFDRGATATTAVPASPTTTACAGNSGNNGNGNGNNCGGRR